MFKPPCDDGVVRGAPPATPCTEVVGRAVLVATILGSSMAFIDGSAVNVALPALQEALAATIVDAQWVVEAYALTLAALMLTGGLLGDRWGRRRVYAAGLVLFAASSVWCGMAPDVGQLIAARGLQGIGGALLVPGSLALISTAFSHAQRGAAIGTWAGATAITAALGPILGGWLVEHASWRGIFFINVPLAAVALGILLAKVPETIPDRSHPRLDWLGAVLASLGLGGVVYGLIESQRLGLIHPAVVTTIAGGVLGLGIFVLWERTAREPMLPLRLFRSSTFLGANTLTLLLYAGLGGALFFFPFNLIQVQGYSATAAGGAFVPFILIMFVLSRWAGGLTGRYGARIPLIVGPLVAAVGFSLFTLPRVGGTYWGTFFPAVVVLGLGMAVSVAPLTTAVMNAVSHDRAGMASGVNNAVSRVAGLVSVAVMGIVLLRVFRHDMVTALADTALPAGVRETMEGEFTQLGAMTVPAELDAPLAARVQEAIRMAFVAGFRTVMWTAAGLAAASAVVAALTLEGRSPEGGR